MNRTNFRVAVTAAALGLLVVGMAGGYWWAKRSPAAPTAQNADAAPSKGERRVLYWYDPMVPEQHFDRPGKSPFMDMQLVPRYADEVATGGVAIDARLQQSVGIRTAVVEVDRLVTQQRVPATLTWDLRRESVVSTPVSAIASRVYIKAPFEPVRRGQPLATVLAPEWSAAIAEANALGQAQSQQARALQAAARQRLRVLGVPGGRIDGGGVILAAPQDGIVSEVLVREGQAVMPGTPLFRVNGIDTLWLEASIPQAGSAGIGPGSKVEASVSAVPGETFEGEVEAMLPQIDAGSRTQRARIVLRNERGLLVPGMFAELTVHGGDGTALPLIPTEALIATGSDSRVIVVGADGRFLPVRIRVGRSSGGRTEVLAGLRGGERVVTSGQFLIDSEASLSGALQRLDQSGASGAEAEMGGHDHGTMAPAAPAQPRSAPNGTDRTLHDHATPSSAPAHPPSTDGAIKEVHDHATMAPAAPSRPTPTPTPAARNEGGEHHDHGAPARAVPAPPPTGGGNEGREIHDHDGMEHEAPAPASPTSDPPERADAHDHAHGHQP